MVILWYLPPKLREPSETPLILKAKKRFSEATEVCEEVHERFQQVPSRWGRWWALPSRLFLMKVTEFKGIT